MIALAGLLSVCSVVLGCSGGSNASNEAEAPSCKAGGDGLTNCGPSAESCCTSLHVEGGTFSRTYANDGTGPTGLADPATVSSFRLDKYDVTVGRFRQFVEAWKNGTGYTPPNGAGKHAHLNGGHGLVNGDASGSYESGWATTDDASIAPSDANLLCAGSPTWTSRPAENEKLPINCVNWYEAYAFCIWDGGFLPSEAEWELAASGGSEQREYPWGSADPGMDNEYAIYGCYFPSGPCMMPAVADIAPVGTPSSGAGASGQIDLAGNMDQWNLDWYVTYGSCTDCASLAPASYRVTRGGSFKDSSSQLHPWSHGGIAPTSRSDSVGLRCARTP